MTHEMLDLASFCQFAAILADAANLDLDHTDKASKRKPLQVSLRGVLYT